MENIINKYIMNVATFCLASIISLAMVAFKGGTKEATCVVLAPL